MKTKITLLTIMLAFIGLSNFINAQTPDWAWATDTTAALGGMTTDASGKLYVANGLGKNFLEKYDNNGNRIWRQSSKGSLDSPPAVKEYPNYIALDPFGNIFVAGSFTSDTLTFGTTNFFRASTVDMFIAKFTNDGNFLWAKTASVGNVGNVGFHVSSDASGNAIVVGSFTAPTLTIGLTTLTNPCGGGTCPSMLVAKYDGNDGTPIWAKSSFAGIGTTYAYSVTTDDLNNIYVGGDFGSDRNSIVKYRSDGDTLWTQKNGGWYLTLDALGNLYSVWDKKAGDALVKKYNSSNGNVLWTSPATGNTSNKGVAITTDAGGNIYFGGTFRSTSITFGTFTLTHAGTGSDDDIFIAKYDKDGTAIWAKAVGGTAFDALNGFATDPSGNVFVGGFFLSPTVSFGTIILDTLPVGYNIFFAKLGDTPVSLKELQSNNTFLLYPNPAQKHLYIESSFNKNTTVEVFNLQGQVINTLSLKDFKTDLQIENLPKGMYIVKLINSDGLAIAKIVKN